MMQTLHGVSQHQRQNQGHCSWPQIWMLSEWRMTRTNLPLAWHHAQFRDRNLGSRHMEVHQTLGPAVILVTGKCTAHTQTRKLRDRHLARSLVWGFASCYCSDCSTSRYVKQPNEDQWLHSQGDLIGLECSRCWLRASRWKCMRRRLSARLYYYHR